MQPHSQSVINVTFKYKHPFQQCLPFLIRYIVETGIFSSWKRGCYRDTNLAIAVVKMELVYRYHVL